MLIFYLTAATIPCSALAIVVPGPRRRHDTLLQICLGTVMLCLGVLTALIISQIKEPALVVLMVPIVACGATVIWIMRYRDDEDEDNPPVDWDRFDSERARWKPPTPVS